MFILIFPEEKSHDGAITQLESVVSGGSGLDVQRALALHPSLVFTMTIAPSVYWKLNFFCLTTEGTDVSHFSYSCKVYAGSA